MFVRMSMVGSPWAVAGSVVDRKCRTTSCPSRAARTSAALRKSPVTVSTPRATNCRAARRGRSKTVTWWPRATRESTTCEPMKPLPPMTRHLATHGLHEDVHERPPGLVPGHVLHTGRRLPRVLVLIRPEHLLDEGV